MSYKALYRKYRPSTFSEVVGQEHITETLKSELKTGKIFHAYLFVGTRGTGKTSCAKILAKAVNCLNLKDGDPCCECEACKAIKSENAIDIVEIDAASNNSVDNMRELREQINFTPADAKYRVYIIDEVHMLTISAFNALLKTLEEPPAHVIFILATTEVHKLPSTILSRCQRFDFKRIDSEKIAERIKYIADNEGFTVTDNAAKMIAAIADGGMRDALSTLDLCVSASNNIDEEVVAKTCGMAGNEYLVNLAYFIKYQDTEKALILIDELYNSSVDMLRLLNELIDHYRNLMIIKTVKGSDKLIVCSSSHLEALKEQANDYDIKDIVLCLRYLQDTLIKMQNGNRRSEMELLLIKMCSPTLRTDIESLERRIAALESSKERENTAVVKTQDIPEIRKKFEPETPVIPEDLPATEDEIIPEITEEIPTDNETETTVLVPNGQIDNETWADILSELSKSAPLLSGILADSKAYIEGELCLIESANSQFPELMNSAGGLYREKLRKAVEAITGYSYRLGPYRKKQAAANPDDPLDALRNKLKDLEIPNSIK